MGSLELTRFGGRYSGAYGGCVRGMGNLLFYFSPIPSTETGQLQELTLNSPKLRRQYLWMKSGARCWYCGARLYSPGEANTEVKKQLIFTADHVYPRSRGGRGRANKVPACKYCNSHKSSRSVEEFREWLQARVFDKAKHPRAPAGEHVTRRWKINAEAVVFYFELARLSDSGLVQRNG